MTYRCPLVFSNTGWVSRRLIARELARIYDIPVVIEKQVSDLALDHLPFLDTTLLKLLHACGMAIRDVTGMSGGVAQAEDAKLGRTQGQEIVQEQLGHVHEGGKEDEKELAGRDSMGAKSAGMDAREKEHVMAEGEAVTRESMKVDVDDDDTGLASAAKRDDARVPVEVWDEFIMSGLKVENSKHARYWWVLLVCRKLLTDRWK